MIVTHKRIFRVVRLQFGISYAPGIAIGTDKRDLVNRLKQVFARFDNLGLKVHETKCEFNEEEYTYRYFSALKSMHLEL